MSTRDQPSDVMSDRPPESPMARHPVADPNPRREAAEERLMRLLGAATERASWGACRRAGCWMGLAFFTGVRRRREIAIANVQRAFPHLGQAAARQVARRSAQNFAMTLCEFLHLRAATPAEVREYADIEGAEHIEAGLRQGRGVLLLTAHLGNWEVMGARAAQDFPLTVVARPSSNSGVQHHIEAVRRAAGLRVISKYDTARASINVLRANGTLGILPDQHAGPEGLLLPLFGHATRFVPALARLALLSRAPVVPAFGVRRTPWLADGRIVARVSPGMYFSPRGDEQNDTREEMVRRGTCRAIEQLEKIVTLHPDQWLWMHRRWRVEDTGAGSALAVEAPDDAVAGPG